MFECRACLRRTLNVLAHDAEALGSRTSLVLTPQLLTPTPRRYLSNSSTSPRAANAPQKSQDRHPLSVENTSNRSRERSLRTELKYLPDAVKLADHVRYTIRCNQPDKALDLCRMASKTMSCVVSWNHVIGWYLKESRIDEALKIYNEMKKRAQFPDSYTYSILLHGLSRPHHHGSTVKAANVAKAVSVYNSMSSPTSRVEPSIIHTNAALRVCAMGLDMDALWGIVSRIPEQGPGSADRITYSIILDAIRHSSTSHNPDEKEQAQNRLKGVNEGRKIWREVIEKWRNGQVILDEDLVCSMARLLLISKRMEDWDDVLTLVQQTTNIERQTPPIGSKNRFTEHVPIQEDAKEESETSQGQSQSPDPGSSDMPAVKVFKPVQALPPDARKPQRPINLTFVTPGNAILSAVMDACSLMRTNKTASTYWDLLTFPPYNIKPDLSNLNSQLRLLSQNRASLKVATLLASDTFSQAGIEPKNITFRIAMSACMRDKMNKHAVSHAGTVVDVMTRVQADPDVHTLTQYLNLALFTDDGVKIVEALHRLDPVVLNLRSRITYGSEATGHSPPDHLVDKEETLIFLQTMVGTIDTLVKRKMVPETEHQLWMSKRKTLDAFITRTKQRMERNPKLPEDNDKTSQHLRLKKDQSSKRMRRAGVSGDEQKGFPPRSFMLSRFRAQGRKQESMMRRAAESEQAKGRSSNGVHRQPRPAGINSRGYGHSPSDLWNS